MIARTTRHGWWHSGVEKLAMLCIYTVCLLNGCDRTSELAQKDNTEGRTTGTRLTSTDGSAARLLEQCAAAYARLTKYCDKGRVVLSYKVDGKNTRDVAPLAVAYEPPNQIGIEAYQLRVSTAGDRLRMRVLGDTSPLSRQVVSRGLPSNLDLPYLLSDAIARFHLTAGLAGAPPQLELLLGKEPFAALLTADAKVTMDGQGSEGAASYHIVKIARGEARYRLWIDSETSLLRRMELPLVALPPAMLSDRRISDIHLSIEFDQVQTNTPIAWNQWQVPSQPLDQTVRYFVQPPALELDPRLGKVIPAFRLESVIPDQSGLDSSRDAGEGRAQLLIWAADHATCRAMIEQLEAALAKLPAAIREATARSVVWAEPNPPAGTSFDNMAERWHIKMPIVIDRQAMGRDILGISQAPTVVILDRKHRLQYYGEGGNPLLAEAIGEMLTRLAGGESLAETMTARATQEQQLYDRQLWLARARDAHDGAFARPGVYPPGMLQLQSLGDRSMANGLVCICSDASHNLWLLDGQGQLECRDAAGKTLHKLPARSDSTKGFEAGGSLHSWHMVVDKRSRYVALGRIDSPALTLVDVAKQHAISVQLGGAAVTDFRWLETPAGSRLAAITNKGRTILLDPLQPQQHSGASPTLPLALLERGQRESIASGYVILEDGRVEPILVEDQSPAALASQVGQTASATLKPSSPTRRLKFLPAAGPWCQLSINQPASGSAVQATLAIGKLAVDEPAVFMLDENLQQTWHAPLPATPGRHAVTAALDPISGVPLWCVAQGSELLHFFSLDGQLIDHSRPESPVHGVALTPIGNELILWVAHPQKLSKYKVVIGR